jgi:SET family sugar efflux transporter-like MFS transporter
MKRAPFVRSSLVPSATLALLRIPAFVAAALGILFAVLAQAMAMSYGTLNAVERAGMSPLQLTVFLTAGAVSGIVFTTLFGRWLDRHARRWPLFLSLVATIAGTGLTAVVTDPAALTLIAFTLLGLSYPAFPLLFGIAKGHLDGADPAVASSGMAALRMLSSLAWAVGPALGALAVAVWHFPGVYAGAAACGLLALVTVIVARLTPVASTAPVETAGETLALWRAALPAAIALTLFHTAMYMGSNAMVIVVVGELRGAETDVGLLFSLCAAIEVVVMGAFVVWPAKTASRPLIVVGFLLFALYFAAPLISPSLATLYWAQISRAAAIGIISVLGMMYIQDMMPGRAGRAAALFANTTNASALISGIGTGTWAAAFGYWSIFGLCAVLSLVAAALIAATRSRRSAA